MAKRSFDATIIAPLRGRDDKRTVHSFLVDIGDGRKARLPLEELRTRPEGATERVLAKGSKLQVMVIHENKGNGRLVVSERAAVFNKILNRLTDKNGWRDLMRPKNTTRITSKVACVAPCIGKAGISNSTGLPELYKCAKGRVRLSASSFQCSLSSSHR